MLSEGGEELMQWPHALVKILSCQSNKVWLFPPKRKTSVCQQFNQQKIPQKVSNLNHLADNTFFIQLKKFQNLSIILPPQVGSIEIMF